MDAIDLLKQDHRRVEKLFSDFLASESETEQEALFQEIHIGLLAHAEAEERSFYPAVRDQDETKVDQAVREHSEVKKMLLDMLDVDFDDEDFDNLLTQLMENVQRHVEEEEGPGGVMEIARRKLDNAALSRMAGEIESIKQSLQRDMAA